MASEWALQRAAVAWCDERTALRTMDPAMAEVFAEILDAELSPLGPLRRALQADSGYAWAWHCNLAMAFYDELVPQIESAGGPYEDIAKLNASQVCNRAAARFMKTAFGVETKEPKGEEEPCE